LDSALSTLVLINGAPGSGKSTLARLLVDERPLALLLDIDPLRGQLGRWSDEPTAAGIAARRLALAMIRIHLKAGFDVVVPQFLFRLPFILDLERVASETGSRFVELALVSSPEEAASRFAKRSGSDDPNHRDAMQLQQAPGARSIEELYGAMIDLLHDRPGTVFVGSIPGDIEGTFVILKRAVFEDSSRLHREG
jgi:predicted kinase